MSDRLNHTPNASTRFMAVDEKEGSVQVPFNKLKEELGGTEEGNSSGPLIYYARLILTGTPSISNVFINTLGINPVISLVDAGDWALTEAGAFFSSDFVTLTNRGGASSGLTPPATFAVGGGGNSVTINLLDSTGANVTPSVFWEVDIKIERYS
jgi:hypothetical protein